VTPNKAESNGALAVFIFQRRIIYAEKLQVLPQPTTDIELQNIPLAYVLKSGRP
jgi:hypothetical protein